MNVDILCTVGVGQDCGTYLLGSILMARTFEFK